MATMASHNGEHTLAPQNVMKKGFSGERAGIPDRMQAQQSQESFLPYEENRRKRHDLAAGHGGLSHPSSGKSNNSSANTAQKMGGTGLPRAAATNNNASGSNNAFHPHAGASDEMSASRLALQGSLSNGLEYSQIY